MAKKYFIIHKGIKHQYAVRCANCGSVTQCEDNHIALEITELVSDYCEECSPDYEGRRLYEYYLSDGSRLMKHGIKHPDGSWSIPFFKGKNERLPRYVRRNAVNI
jgi:hypothetical protein